VTDVTRDELLLDVRWRFAEAGIDTPELDARVLLTGIIGVDATELVLRGSAPVEEAERRRVEEAVNRRLAGEPVHRILGHRAFFDLDLELSPATLEPRPDTEILVEAVLPHVERIAAATGSCRILDMGTGTGAICLALLSACSQARGIGVDIAQEALETARSNAERNGLSGRFETIESDWFQTVAGLHDVIVSNPPYIKSGEIPHLAPEVRNHDPLVALDGGEDGLAAYRILARDAKLRLVPGGVVGVEFGADQRDAVEEIFHQNGYRTISKHTDLAGRDRAIVAACPTEMKRG
jgi:release factor glutamine methyltransferase